MIKYNEGDRIRFIKDNTNCGPSFGAEGDLATVVSQTGESLVVALDSRSGKWGTTIRCVELKDPVPSTSTIKSITVSNDAIHEALVQFLSAELGVDFEVAGFDARSTSTEIFLK